MSKLFDSNFLLESSKWSGFLKILCSMVKSSKPLCQGITISCWTIGHSQLENVFYETRINIIESFENFNTQTTIVGNIHGAFS